MILSKHSKTSRPIRYSAPVTDKEYRAVQKYFKKQRKKKAKMKSNLKRLHDEVESIMKSKKSRENKVPVAGGDHVKLKHVNETKKESCLKINGDNEIVELRSKAIKNRIIKEKVNLMNSEIKICSIGHQLDINDTEISVFKDTSSSYTKENWIKNLFVLKVLLFDIIYCIGDPVTDFLQGVNLILNWSDLTIRNDWHYGAIVLLVSWMSGLVSVIHILAYHRYIVRHLTNFFKKLLHLFIFQKGIHYTREKEKKVDTHCYNLFFLISYIAHCSICQTALVLEYWSLFFTFVHQNRNGCDSIERNHWWIWSSYSTDLQHLAHHEGGLGKPFRS